jgi:hypothetical protein
MQSPHRGQTIMQMMYAKKQVPSDPHGMTFTTIPHSIEEGQKNFNAQRYRNFFQGMSRNKIDLPNDVTQHGNNVSDAHRNAMFMHNSAMPWNNKFMVTETDAGRLNNVSQQSFVKQKQWTGPNSLTQFYAFMHAMSAAFGQIASGN